jgi:ubiquilin
LFPADPLPGPSELKIQITISPDKSVLDLKRAIAEQSDVEADRQRLIYSGASLAPPPLVAHTPTGRVLKVPISPLLTCRSPVPPQDEDPLSVYKIQSAHTIHMVKGSARPAPPSGASSAPPSQQIPTMQAGQSPSDPLTLLNGYMGHGLMAGFNPFSELGLNQNDPNMVRPSSAAHPID